MIKLIVPDYCQSCAEFEPRVTQRPEQLNTVYGETYFYGDTIVECQYRRRCEAMYDHLKKEKNNESV